VIERGTAQIRRGEFGLIKERMPEIAAFRSGIVGRRLRAVGRRLFV